MEKIAFTLVDYLWSNALVFLAMSVGIYFTVVTRGVQFRHFKEMWRLIREKKDSSTGISSKQALFMALAGRIGVGNIAGVATAIGAGGPGALFWMIVMGFVGSALAFAESTVSQVYKFQEGNEYRGGIQYYIERGLKMPKLAAAASIVLLLSYLLFIPGVQSNTIATTFERTFGLNTWLTGAVVTAAIGLIIWGGVNRIGQVAEKIVPVMSLMYVLATIALLAAYYYRIPEIIMLVVKSAFGMDAVFGGIVGQAVAWGVRRAIFASAAGAGEATFASAAASVSHPVKQGLIQAFSIFFETIFILTSSGVIVLITNAYNVIPGGKGAALVEYVPGIPAGSAWTSLALNSLLGEAGNYLVAAAIFIFAFTTLMTYYYVAETAIVYFDRNGRYPVFKTLAKIVSLAVLMFGSVQSAELMWAFGDIGFGGLAYVNLVALLLLTKPTVRALRDYERQLKAGKEPVFDPREAGVENAGFWIDYSEAHHAHHAQQPGRNQE